MAIPKKDKIFVGLQLLLFIAYLLEVEMLMFRISENMHKLALFCGGIGLVLVLVALLQLKTSLSPFPSPKKGTKLITGGVFVFARHPIYAGILFMAFGISVWLGSGYKLIISVLLYLLFFLKSRYEEQLLQETFPEYVEYKKHTGRFFPKFNWRI
ncbi:MAG: isoprenylcysteine carboxylmethyltransferase family protein [Salinimicrobium sediminis]|uniref:Protein-S-isoprenylcysteine O-methyltransferase Ste14 n=1 Tax=Salinimicrobium sediminis TaxID=1343891 RepID=A0A285X5N4_9FLAO|nr:isoprenylcysteine carboxylmethyltransferase family protein [Salinimicrobium sediminis]MDX1602830.1 isoprenylcysteine carboxylmethyltransferase family protein [Salinimicrobium sediminis]SOC80647.1 Protein-S-isoprenylcysteine O-methyltransferase Ste14 [Salinimicrobium sediminis]